MYSNVLDELENLTKTPTTSAGPAPTPRPSAPSPLGVTVQKIIKDCGLVDALGQSVCLCCASRVLAMDSKKRATLYCSALYRDLEVAITECTAFTPRGGIGCWESLDRRQQYKRQILTERYNAQISAELADRLLYVDRKGDQTTITLRGYAGAVAGQVIDKGDRMAASHRGNHTEILTLVDLAKAKGWSQIHLTGSESFKARAYIEAMRAGLTVVGYEPSPELRAQLEKEIPMFGQAGTAGMMALTPDAATAQISPASRWLDPLRDAREKLTAEHRAIKQKLVSLQHTNLKKLELDLAAEHGGEHYCQALADFKAATTAAKDANVFTRMRAESRLERTRRYLQVAHSKALAVPAAASALASAIQQNKEHDELSASLIPIKLGIGELEYLEDAVSKGRDPEAEFAEAWRLRKSRPLNMWQQYALAPVFEADAAHEKARLKAETDAAELAKTTQRQEQIQREISAQQLADSIQEQLGKPGLTAEMQDMLEQQQRYYLALADGHEEEEAKERSLKKSSAPRLH